jgi:uncharacterized flavoprotein (TIGR03862 family)
MKIAIIGGGPAGLMAAEAARGGGAEVDVYDAMASVGRKFLLAGKGGLNLTHEEPLERFLARYGARRTQIAPLLRAFGPEALCRWVHGLGIKTFVGTSGRVFPADMKAAPLLRTWLSRLRKSGVRFHIRHRWSGWGRQEALRFATPQGERTVRADAIVLALGGGSWPNLGSDAAWIPLLAGHGVSIAPLQPANCGFDIQWSEHLRTKFAGHPVKSVAVVVRDAKGGESWHPGEFVVTETGVEGGVIYAVSALLRDEILKTGAATLCLDLAPDRDLPRLVHDLSRPRGKKTMATHLQRQTRITGVKAALLREVVPKQDFADPARLAVAIKRLPLTLVAPRPLKEAISTAGGVRFEALDERMMIRALPGVFCAGEMLDWEAPTGGYLLTACFASGLAAGTGSVNWCRSLATKGRAGGTKACDGFG